MTQEIYNLQFKIKNSFRSLIPDLRSVYLTLMSFSRLDR